VFWCVFNMAPGPAIQKYLVELSPDTAAIQISLNTSAIQLGVALGAFIGAILVDKAPRATPSWIALVLRLIWIAEVSGLSSTRYFWIAGPGAMLNTHQNTTAPSS
ncbi:hypothetical protein ACV34C_31515, partial [Pseudomonas aeruginosa]